MKNLFFLMSFLIISSSQAQVTQISFFKTEDGDMWGEKFINTQTNYFKKFVEKRNDPLLRANNLKIFERLEGDKKLFKVEVININSKEEGDNLFSILSKRQFSCILFKE